MGFKNGDVMHNKTHLVDNYDNRITLRSIGSEEIKYDYVASGGHGMTIKLTVNVGLNEYIQP